MPHRYSNLVVCLLLVGAGLAGCAPSRSTRMTAEDLEDMATRMAESLKASPVLATRRPDSPAMVVSISKVENLSTDVMPPGEQWYVMQRLRSALPMLALRQERNVRFVIPPERLEQLKADPNYGVGVSDLPADAAAGRNPTHLMTATFNSTPRADATHRTEWYFCDFALIDLAGGQRVWNDRIEYKRVASGHIWD